MGIQFAPLHIPMERRLQTLATCCAFITFIFLGPISYLFVGYVIFFTRFYWIALIYCAFWYGEGNVASRGGRWSKWVRGWRWWTYFRDYFPVKLVKTVELPTDKNYLFCSFPHGVLCSGAFTCFATDALDVAHVLPGIRTHMITLDQNFNMPIFREMILGLGCCASSKESLSYLLGAPGRGNAVILVVGGAAEALKCKPGTYRVILKSRKGFVKIALRNGVSLVPVFSFGETDLYDQWENPEGSWLRSAQNLFRKVTGIAPVVLMGRGFFQYSFGIIPKRTPVTTVVGTPIDVDQVEDPTEEQVDELHQKFMDALMALFETEKHKYIPKPDETFLTID